MGEEGVGVWGGGGGDRGRRDGDMSEKVVGIRGGGGGMGEEGWGYE